MNPRFAAALHEQAVESALRDLILAWRHHDRLLGADAPLVERNSAESVIDDLFGRLSLILPQLPPHEESPSEENPCPPARLALEMLEGGAWAVLYHGGRLVIQPNPAEKVWETSVITGYRDEWNEEIGMAVSLPIRERRTFKTLNGALGFACEWLRRWKGGIG